MSTDAAIQNQAEGDAENHALFRCAGLGGLDAEFEVKGVWFIDQCEADPFTRIQDILDEHQREGCSWAILLSYEFGGWVEPNARSSVSDLESFPLVVLMQLGDEVQQNDRQSDFDIGSMHSQTGRDRYIEQVERVQAYIAAGDIYQANIAHRLSGTFTGDSIACSEALIASANPRHGSLARFRYNGVSHTVCSISPELFIRLDQQSRIILTEPMKGTRPIDADANELEHSDKDRAELNMITDLMRNDIGRVCRLGSVRVRTPRRIEPHGSGVLQASSVIEGEIREGLNVADLIRAIFPPGSVTGAPKVRAMQVIDELEQSPRRAYCGSMMHIDSEGNIEASVSIRTAHIWGDLDPDMGESWVDGHMDYPVGAGIVADSVPVSEWEETLLKAAILKHALGVELVENMDPSQN